ncbi:MAG: methyltransferase domain-containing protein [Deltaproteobacteria bacterium]|nr:MAG: methyltransferase domain-containing protein [Deltaproteobacteria bacterium]
MAEETLDRIAGNWHIYQLKHGHRFSTDDQVCAWHAAREFPQARRLLDLGCGLGSVGLSLLHRLGPDATLVGIEAQDVSFELATRTVAHNGLEDRVRILHGDIRDASLLDERFELITGSPPYIPLGKGVVSPHPQRAACRMELRGSIFDYAESARRWLAPGGGFCVVMAAGDPRTEEGPIAAGFEILSRVDYAFREGRPPTIATLFCRPKEEGPFPPRRDETVIVRAADGEFSEEYAEIRAGTDP